jgi:hypothetical protein
MEPSFPQKKKRQTLGKRIAIFLLFFILISSALLAPLKPAKAQMVVSDPFKLAWDKITDVAKKLWQKGGSLAFQQTLRTALNKIAYDSANWVGSGGEGQKPLFITEDWGTYLAKVGDEAAGTFLENFAANMSSGSSPAQCDRELTTCTGHCDPNQPEPCYSNCGKAWQACIVKVESGAPSGLTFNFCQPTSLEAKVKIGLGLSQYNQPQGPACTATKMIDNWGDAAKKYEDFKDPQFLNKMADVFDPNSSELGIWWTASTDMMDKKIEGEEVASKKLVGKGGWLDPIKISGDPISLPNQAQLQMEDTYSQYSSNFGKYTGDAFVDAGNLFLSQLSITAFNKLVQSIGKKDAKSVDVSSGTEQDPTYGDGKVSLEGVTVKLIQPNYGVGSVYDILSELAVCPDKNNPGPTNCVIDSNFMQGISEQKTVAEAIKDGSLHGNWRFTLDNQVGAYENSYSYRNISILRAYRIVPASWELVFEKMNIFQKLADDNKGVAKKATLSDLVSCFDPYDDNNKFSADFDVYDQGWCTGLIDPNWVLKAPVNYCKKEGFSAQITNTSIIPSQPAIGDTPYTPAEVSILRADNYCADNQTCIQEGKDGGCEAYGYCNEEKRTWSFSGESCEPIYNTCQSFIRSDSDKAVSYLENTLDYGICGKDNAGCKRYSYVGNYDVLKGTAIWNEANVVYLNENASNCSAKDEGCSEFIRVKPVWGANLVMNSDFVNDAVGASSTSNSLNDWPIIASAPVKSTIVDKSLDSIVSNGRALKIQLFAPGNVAIVSDYNKSLLPNNLELVYGQAYTLSADIYLAAGSKVVLSIGSGANTPIYESNTLGVWKHVSLTRKAGDDFSQPGFAITSSGAAGQTIVYVQNIKFEMSNYDTGYSSYGASKVYQKLLPQYLESACYDSDTQGNLNYTLKVNAPEKCYKYSRRCNQSEVGCDLYTSAKSNFSVPAKLGSMDYCPAECIGYDVYVARETYFNSAQADNIIPETARSCSAESVGCNEFTNLDTLQAGGENREYYSALKHCVKPSQASCGSFYSWEGTGTGYQLRLYSLQKEADNTPSYIKDDQDLCNEIIFNAPISSPLYNSDCKQLYTSDGKIYYHLSSNLITCSESCRAYRITEKNYNRRLTQAQCSGLDKSWDASAGACVSCINGGVWNNTHKACVYQGIPGEGKTCSINEMGCREYNGNEGNKVRLAASYDFETQNGAWTSNCDNGIKIETVASNNGGHSLYYNNSASACSEIGTSRHILSQSTPLIKQIMAGDTLAAQLKVSTTVKKGQAYSVKFLASSLPGADIKIYLYNPETKQKSEFNTGNAVKVTGGGAWQVYSANLENLDHDVSNNEILALSANSDFYIDNFIITEITDRFYLIKSSSKVPSVCYYDNLDIYQGADYNLGCAAYSDKTGTSHNLRTFSSICDKSSIGCEQVISTKNYDFYGKGFWNDTNKNKVCDIDEPDCVKVDSDSAIYMVFNKANSCNQADLGCSMLGQAKVTNGKTFWSDVFKKNNPNNYNTTICNSSSVGCEAWKNVEDGGLSYFRDPGANVCTYKPSQRGWYKTTETGEVACEYSYFKTIGNGGTGNQVPVPTKEVGLCEAKLSGCSEYIDPVSQFNPDLVILGTTTIAIKPNTLYVLSSTSSSAINITFNNDVKPLLINNTLGTSTKSISVGDTIKNSIFNSLNNTSATKPAAAVLEVRELAVGYQLKSTIDKSSCSGTVDFDNGCVLFNERIIAGASGYTNLTGFFDPYVGVKKSPAVKCNPNQSGSCVANQLIKVRPNRVCSGWLDCATYAKDPETGAEICYALKQCNSLNDKLECNNFITTPGSLKPANATGYSFLNRYNISNMKEVGLNSEAHYDFEEFIPSLSCIRIAGGGDCSFNNIIKELVVREPKANGPSYPASGKSYVKVPAAFSVSPQPAGNWINLSPNQEYYINYLLNTKNSGNAATIVIAVSGGTNKSFTAVSPNGWSRKIHKFTTSAGETRIRIYLQSGSSVGVSAEGEAYFDDINIEPVLQTGDNQYVARECRLYPTNSSLSCKNQSKNVIKDGLEGYCLEHDKTNTDVCTTWYPADRVSSSVLGSQSLGYNGPTGLSYCTNIKSNIKFAKKIVTKMVRSYEDKHAGSYVGTIDCSDLNNNNCDQILCSNATSSPIYDPNCTYNEGFQGIVSANSDKCFQVDGGRYCGDSQNYVGIVVNDKQSWNNEFLYCVPKETGNQHFLFGVGAKTNASLLPHALGLAAGNGCSAISFYSEAWVVYNGKFIDMPVELCEDTGVGLCEPIHEAGNAEPPIRIFDNNYPAVDEQGLQYLSANSGDRDKVFNFTCNNFAQVVSGSGVNKAWVVRTGSKAVLSEAFDTPPYFKANPDIIGLKFYGRQRNGVPFGAATFPENYDILNSGPLYLQNQYYLKDKQKIFGGRPYGCTGNSCMNIGYCSDNPNVMCVFIPNSYNVDPYGVVTYSTGNNDTDYINKKTCSDGGFGVCRPLWDSSNTLAPVNILKNIFLQSYGSFKYSSGGYIPDNINWDIDNIPEADDPEIVAGSVKLKFNGIDTFMKVTKSGVYSLEFNTKVNPEQQPLRMIYIDWGDGTPTATSSRQAITGQDHRPDVNNPHVIYHYYNGVYNPLSVKIKIWDNWDKTDSY